VFVCVCFDLYNDDRRPTTDDRPKRQAFTD
jgi:hypothetical protein